MRIDTTCDIQRERKDERVNKDLELLHGGAIFVEVKLFRHSSGGDSTMLLPHEGSVALGNPGLREGGGRGEGSRRPSGHSHRRIPWDRARGVPTLSTTRRLCGGMLRRRRPSSITSPGSHQYADTRRTKGEGEGDSREGRCVERGGCKGHF